MRHLYLPWRSIVVTKRPPELGAWDCENTRRTCITYPCVKYECIQNLNYNTVTPKKIRLRESVVDTVPELRAVQLRNRESTLGRGQNTSSGTFRSPLSHTLPRTQWGAAGSLSKEVLRPGRETDHSHPVPWLMMGGDIPPIPHMSIMTCAQTTLPYRFVNLRDL